MVVGRCGEGGGGCDGVGNFRELFIILRTFQWIIIELSG